MAGNSNLASAMGAKQDEFYTQLRTIEDELRHYRKHFKGKTVLCNCDDPFESNFFKYFALNFNKLGLKKLIATCYAGSSIAGTQLSLFGDDTDEERRTPYKAIVTTVHDATGKGAEVVIWVVAHARDEHRQAIEWLNQHTDSDFGFFLVEVELWKIGDSLPAPRFGVVEQPNEWTKTVKLSEGLSETEKVKLAYWTAYRDVAGGHPEFLKEFSPQKPSKDHWSTLRLGVSAYHLALLIDTQKGRTGIELYVDDDKIGHRAIANSGVFEKRLGLTAVTFDAKKASGLRFYKAGHPIKGHQDAWPGYIEEQLGWALEMKRIIAEIEL